MLRVTYFKPVGSRHKNRVSHLSACGRHLDVDATHSCHFQASQITTISKLIFLEDTAISSDYD
jgi:hypothetical protein